MLFKYFTLIILSFFCVACAKSPQSDFISYEEDRKVYKGFIVENKRTLPPYGYVDFCQKNAHECPEWHNFQNKYSDFQATASISNRQLEKQIGISFRQPQLGYSQVLHHLQKVNNIVNIAIQPVTDAEGFGVTEKWRIPNISAKYGDIGDCEDYALLKRKILSQIGFPYKNLSISVVEQTNGNIHAVLLVRTSYGDFVLDNLNRRVQRWDQTKYKWIKKQSFSNPALWVRTG